MSRTTLTERRVRVTVRVTRDDGPAEYVFTDNRMSITVSMGGGQYGNAKVQVYGAPLDAMNNIARLWLEILTPDNRDELLIDVLEGDTFVPLFAGVITWSAVNAASMPLVALEIEANAAMAAMNTVVPPYSQDTPIDLQQALATILEPAGFAPLFAENVPPLQVQRCYLQGTPQDQVSALMSYFPEVVGHYALRRFVVRLVNAPIDESALQIDATTGRIGYPTYSTSGLSLAVLFDARVRLGVALDVRTEFDFVNRTRWVASVIQHTLEPNTPGGQWVTQIAAATWGRKGNANGSET